MKQHVVLLLALGGLLLPAGCGDEDDDRTTNPTPGTQFIPTAQCTGECFEDLGKLLYHFLEIGKTVNDMSYTSPPDVTGYNRLTKEFWFRTSLDDDPAVETVVSGLVRSSYNIDDGIQGGEAAAVFWSMRTQATGDTTGYGGWSFAQFAQTYDGFRMLIVDSTQTNPRNPRILTQDGCDFELTGYAVHIDSLGGVDCTRPWEFFYTGTIEFTTHADGGDLSGLVVLDGTTTVDVQAWYLGEARSFTIDLETYEVTF